MSLCNRLMTWGLCKNISWVQSTLIVKRNCCFSSHGMVACLKCHSTICNIKTWPTSECFRLPVSSFACVKNSNSQYVTNWTEWWTKLLHLPYETAHILWLNWICVIKVNTRVMAASDWVTPPKGNPLQNSTTHRARGIKSSTNVSVVSGVLSSSYSHTNYAVEGHTVSDRKQSSKCFQVVNMHTIRLCS